MQEIGFESLPGYALAVSLVLEEQRISTIERGVLSEVSGRIERGEESAQALHQVRQAWLRAGQGEWTENLLVFE